MKSNVLTVSKAEMTASTFEEACTILFGKTTEVTRLFVYPGFGTISVDGNGDFDWKETVDGFRFFPAQ